MTRVKKFILMTVLFVFPGQSSFAGIIDSTPVGPGVIHYHVVKDTGPWQIHVLEIDLTNKWLKLKTVKANDRIMGRERTSLMAARSDRDRHRVVAAINADFFDAGGIPVGAQIMNGILLKRPTTRSVFGITFSKKPFIEIVSFDATLQTKSGTSITIDGINEVRGKDQLILYNNFYGNTTRTNIWGTEIIAEYIDEPAVVNDTFRVVVTAKDSVADIGHGNNNIPPGGFVLSGHARAGLFLNKNVFVRDTLSLVLKLPPVDRPVAELIGGTPRLIRDGVATVTWDTERTRRGFAFDRHPRTAVGFNQDTTRLYFFIVDGRQPGYSMGMTLFELADYMLEWGVYQGINLDGGGSTTMVVRGETVNQPSDATGERAVANALLVISSAPAGPVAMLKITPGKTFVLSTNKVQFSASGLDKYFNPLGIHPDSLKWSCDPQIGDIDQTGLFTAGMKQDSGYVYVAYRTIRDSARVYITKVSSIKLFSQPDILMVEQNQVPNVKFQIKFKPDVITLSPDSIARSDGISK